MKALLIASALLASASAFAQTAPCGAEAQANLADVESHFAAGDVTRTDVAQAQLLALDTALECGTKTKAQYCTEATTWATTFVEGTKEEERMGMHTVADYTAALKAKLEVQKACSGSLKVSL